MANLRALQWLSLILAIFPGIIFLFTLIAYIPIDGFQEQLLSMMEVLLPSSVYDSVDGTF